MQATTALQKCEKCLPSDGDTLVDICLECRGTFERGKLPKACSVNNMGIGCEHRYPKELGGLSPLEERLIALQAPFGYIAKLTIDNKTPTGVSYRTTCMKTSFRGPFRNFFRGEVVALRR